MKRAAIAIALLAAMPLRAGSVAIAQHAALATPSPRATAIGLDVLRRGGNAIDAAVAVAFALGDIGGGGFLVYYDAATRSVWTLDFREVAPAAPRKDALIAVPGTVAGLAAMHERFGSLAWKELVEPAVRLAGDSKDLAATLQRIAQKGAADFYEGETARFIADSHFVSHRDLRDYQAVWRAPIKIAFREYEIYTLPPPSAAGLMIGEQLEILSGFDLRKAGDHTPLAIHLIAEASRRAAIDRDKYVGDPTTLRTPYRELLSADRAKQWRTSIDPLRATPTMTLAADVPATTASAHTKHFSIVDAHGNIAAVTTSLGDENGSGFVVPHCGFVLNDAMKDFAKKEPSPNAIAGSRRMASSISPAIILRRGSPYLVLGAAGGTAIPNIVLQTFLGVAIYDKSLPDSIAAARCDQQAIPEDMRCENLKVPAETIDRLRAMGHGVITVESIGDVEALMLETRRITAVSDPRHGGAAGGF